MLYKGRPTKIFPRAFGDETRIFQRAFSGPKPLDRRYKDFSHEVDLALLACTIASMLEVKKWLRKKIPWYVTGTNVDLSIVTLTFNSIGYSRTLYGTAIVLDDTKQSLVVLQPSISISIGSLCVLMFFGTEVRCNVRTKLPGKVFKVSFGL